MILASLLRLMHDPHTLPHIGCVQMKQMTQPPSFTVSFQISRLVLREALQQNVEQDQLWSLYC